MFVLEANSPYFSSSEIEANFDPPQCRELEPWEVRLEAMKKAILAQDFLKARKLMYSLESEVVKSKMEAFNDGYEKGSLPLPF